MASRVLWLAALALGLGSIAVVTGRAASSPDTVTVARWVDGDTVEVHTAGETVTVRLYGVDTPEARSYRGANECVQPTLAAAATDRARALAPVGAAVTLDRHGHDRYGRTLARVSVAGVDVGAVLASDGLARLWPDGECPK